MNIISEHKKKLEYFKRLKIKEIPNLKKKILSFKNKLKQCYDKIREQKTAAGIVFKLKPARRNKKRILTEEEKERLEKNEIIKKENMQYYEKSSNLENEIRKKEKILNELMIEESEYLLDTMNILKEYDEIDHAERSGMYESIFEENITYPTDKKVHYRQDIQKDIKINFVTKENRIIFKKNYLVNPKTTNSQIKSMYCLLLKNLCGNEYDLSINTIIEKKGKIYLTEYKLLFPNNKNLNEVIKFYGIPITKELQVYIAYPDEEGEEEELQPLKKIKTNVRSRKRLFEKYKEVVTKVKKISFVNYDDCINCDYNGSMMEDTREGQLHCPKCGTVQVLSMIAKGFKGVPYNHEVYYTKQKSDYKPIMHLNDILKQRQATESTIVPENILIEIEEEINKYRWMKIETVNYENIKMILKKLSKGDKDKKINYPKYYEHIPQIILKLGGSAPIRYSEEDILAIKYWFNRLLEPFNLLKPREGRNKRSNLFSYNYLLRNICLLIAKYQKWGSKEQIWWINHSRTFSLLKDRKKLFIYDQYMSKMFDLIDEDFIAAV